MRSKKSTRITGAVQTRGVVATAIAVALVAGLFALHAWTRIAGTMAGYELSTAQNAQHELLREQKALQLELATRRAAGRIEADARKRLGMVEPRAEQIFPIPGPKSPAANVATARAER